MKVLGYPKKESENNDCGLHDDCFSWKQKLRKEEDSISPLQLEVHPETVQIN